MDLHDENKAVLADIEKSGSDLSEPRQIDFEHVFPSEKHARAFATLSEEAGYKTLVWRSDDGEWNATAQTTILPSPEDITRTEMRLDELAQTVGGKADGWGFFRTNL